MHAEFEPLMDWLRAGKPVLDLRPLMAYQHGHANGALSITEQELYWRRQELPPPGTALLLISDAPHASQQLLENWQYPVAHSYQWTDGLARYLSTHQALAIGDEAVRLWQASPVLQRALPQALAEIRSAGLSPDALDLACGSGRDAVYMAMYGCQVTAIDHHADALVRGETLARRHQVTVQWQQADIEAAEFDVAANTFSLVHVARFLYRPLLPKLSAALRPGGYLFYETFAVGAEKFGSPRNPKYLLEPGELRGVFSDLTVLLDVIETLDDGRPVQRFVARKSVGNA